MKNTHFFPFYWMLAVLLAILGCSLSASAVLLVPAGLIVAGVSLVAGIVSAVAATGLAGYLIAEVR